jgi:hypothetical protein
MLTGSELGQAIKKALEVKGFVGPTAVAKRFDVKPPSVSGWFANGAIQNARLFEIMDMCSDVLGPNHWGLDHWPGNKIRSVLDLAEPAQIYNGASKLVPVEDRDIAEVISIMRNTDMIGRARAVGAVKAALADYQPTKSKLAG